MFETKDSSSTRPYLIRALYEWCTDSGYTPFLAVLVDGGVSVPMEFVKNGEIVLNISFDATSSLSLGNEFIEFKGRFGGVARDIVVPVDRVLAIYARENGQGMAFPMAQPLTTPDDSLLLTSPKAAGSMTSVVTGLVPAENSGGVAGVPKPSSTSRPSLTRIK